MHMMRTSLTVRTAAMMRGRAITSHTTRELDRRILAVNRQDQWRSSYLSAAIPHTTFFCTSLIVTTTILQVGPTKCLFFLLCPTIIYPPVLPFAPPFYPPARRHPRARARRAHTARFCVSSSCVLSFCFRFLQQLLRV